VHDDDAVPILAAFAEAVLELVPEQAQLDSGILKQTWAGRPCSEDRWEL
jgi:hypothetical protein